jgi:AAA domain
MKQADADEPLCETRQYGRREHAKPIGNSDSAVARLIRATPYRWIDEKDIPPRDFLHGSHHPRGYVVVDIATGGAGKTAFNLAEAIAMVAGRNLLGQPPGEKLKVWYWCLEDPLEELTRRIQAICHHYGITEQELGGRLFVNGREQPLCITTAIRNAVEISPSIVEGFINEISECQIDLLIIDPFISCHEAPENDNNAQDKVAKAWGGIAVAAKCCVKLVHHIRKADMGDVSTASARGSKALTDAARSVRIFQSMNDADAPKAGVDNARRYFKVFIDKANMTPIRNKESWFQFINAELGNGDFVGVVAPWEWPDAFAGISPDDTLRVQQAIDGHNFRESSQAANWVGHTIAAVLEIDLNGHGRERVKELIKTWIKNNVLRIESIHDANARRKVPCIAVGKWINAG